MESNLRICKVCQQLKQRIDAGKFNADKKDKKYVDSEGKLWNGSCCPPCNLIRINNKMKEKRKCKMID